VYVCMYVFIYLNANKLARTRQDKRKVKLMQCKI